jgi:hypothetical protein
MDSRLLDSPVKGYTWHFPAARILRSDPGGERESLVTRYDGRYRTRLSTQADFPGRSTVLPGDRARPSPHRPLIRTAARNDLAEECRENLHDGRVEVRAGRAPGSVVGFTGQAGVRHSETSLPVAV